MINAEFHEDCCFCLPRIEESILHRFWDYPSARRVWNWATSLMNKLRTRRSHVGPWPAFEMKDVIFTDTLPMQFKKFKLIWPLLKGACVWAMWTQRNEKIFANSTWSDERVLDCVWQAMIEYGQIAWKWICLKAKQFPRKRAKLLSSFNRSWMACRIFGHRSGDRVLWRQRPPCSGLIIHPHVP
jgi:hypothetical protein